MEVLILILIVAGFFSFIVYEDRQYKKTAYYQVTKNPYSSIKYDKGKYGEYLVYKRLQKFEATGARFLFNVYIPKWDDERTEIDVLLICSKGILVFESKNYSGWIFGDERNRHWTQVLPMGRRRCHKERFYNPIMQNAAHIKHLRRVVHSNVPIRSIIVFSDRCSLKDVKINSDVRIVNCGALAPAVGKIFSQSVDFLTNTEIGDLYNRIYPYTQTSSDIRKKHVSNIKM